jgi:2-polyprenyl-3-methyl-5-hydroxy-6-metoxy-1,4-benzoquinol methylase
VTADEHAARWHRECLLCSSSRLQRLPAYAGAHLVRCRACGFVFASRGPSDAELEHYYRDYGHEWFDSPINRQRYRELLDTFEPYRATNRILDSGCGAGYFLEEARARGWEVYGTEYSERAIEICRHKGLEVVQAPVHPGTYEPGFFDVATSFEVVEHLRDPLPEALVLSEVVRPGGMLYCTTPNFNTLSRRLLRSSWSIVSYPEHLCYFTPATLRSWLRRAGFEQAKLITTGFSLARLRGSLGAAAPSVGEESDDERLRAAIEQRRSLQLAKETANSILSALRAGDTLKGWFVRR